MLRTTNLLLYFLIFSSWFLARRHTNLMCNTIVFLGCCSSLQHFVCRKSHTLHSTSLRAIQPLPSLQLHICFCLILNEDVENASILSFLWSFFDFRWEGRGLHDFLMRCVYLLFKTLSSTLNKHHGAPARFRSVACCMWLSWGLFRLFENPQMVGIKLSVVLLLYFYVYILMAVCFEYC